MKVALYQEGNNWESPDIIKIFSSMRNAINSLSDGFLTSEITDNYVTAVNHSTLRWVTIKLYDIEDS